MDWMMHAAYWCLILVLLIFWLRAEQEKIAEVRKNRELRQDKSDLFTVRMAEVEADKQRFDAACAEKDTQIAALQIDLKTARIINEAHWATAKGGDVK